MDAKSFNQTNSKSAIEEGNWQIIREDKKDEFNLDLDDVKKELLDMEKEIVGLRSAVAVLLQNNFNPIKYSIDKPKATSSLMRKSSSRSTLGTKDKIQSKGLSKSKSVPSLKQSFVENSTTDQSTLRKPIVNNKSFKCSIETSITKSSEASKLVIARESSNEKIDDQKSSSHFVEQPKTQSLSGLIEQSVEKSADQKSSHSLQRSCTQEYSYSVQQLATQFSSEQNEKSVDQKAEFDSVEQPITQQSSYCLQPVDRSSAGPNSIQSSNEITQVSIASCTNQSALLSQSSQNTYEISSNASKIESSKVSNASSNIEPSKRMSYNVDYMKSLRYSSHSLRKPKFMNTESIFQKFKNIINSTELNYVQTYYPYSFDSMQRGWRLNCDLGDDSLIRKARELLDELTPRCFELIANELNCLKLETEGQLVQLVDLIYDKAINSSTNFDLFAKLCKSNTQLITDNQGRRRIVRLGIMMMQKCQINFECSVQHKHVQATHEKEIRRCVDNAKKQHLIDYLEIEKTFFKMKSLGNIELMAHLYKYNPLYGIFIDSCIDKLISYDNEDSYEFLCVLLKTIGYYYEKNTKNKNKFDQQMISLEKALKQFKIEMRVKFIIIETVNLRKNGWRAQIRHVPVYSSKNLYQPTQQITGHTHAQFKISGPNDNAGYLKNLCVGLNRSEKTNNWRIN